METTVVEKSSMAGVLTAAIDSKMALKTVELPMVAVVDGGGDGKIGVGGRW